MGTILSQVTSDPILKPPRIAIHGNPKVGKTTFGMSAPKALLMPVEDGEGALSVARLPRPECFTDVLNSIAELVNEDHDFKTLVLDSIDHIEPLIWQQVCDDDGKGKKHIEDFGYGRGLKFADTHWIRLFHGLDVLRGQGMTVIVIAHSHTKNIEDPIIGTYSRTAPKIHDRANALLVEWADVLGGLVIEKVAIDRGEGNRTTRTAQTTGARVLHLEDNGSILAGNRYSLPATIQIPKEDGYNVLRNLVAKALGLDTKPKATAKPKKEAA